MNKQYKQFIAFAQEYFLPHWRTSLTSAGKHYRHKSRQLVLQTVCFFQDEWSNFLHA